MPYPSSYTKRLFSRFSFPAALLGTSLSGAYAQPAMQPEANVQPVWMLPFVLLLLTIAVFPLVAKRIWDKWYWVVSIGLGILTIGYYLSETHNLHRVLTTAQEYVSFICLIGSLFVVSGGILIHLWRPGNPLFNVLYLAIGAILANLFGTTGASVLLIRPYIRTNRGRLKPYHIVFFIFIVSNIGGVLTPIGDPPLFLGYLNGVPFFWLPQHVILIWLFAVGLILGIFFVIDRMNPVVLPQTPPPAGHRWIELMGIHNFIYLIAIIVSVLMNSTLNRIMPFLPETIQVTAALLSFFTTSKEVHSHNFFSFLPIIEVTVLFAGIFATMIPVLQYLEHNASQMGVTTPGMFYWYSGMLSSVLDNAPTYLAFFSTAIGLHGEGIQVILQNETMYRFIIAISVGAVFFGASTYIGNGPNLLVKSIAEDLGCTTPSFLGYISKYSIPILLPVFALVWLIWFR